MGVKAVLQLVRLSRNECRRNKFEVFDRVTCRREKKIFRVRQGMYKEENENEVEENKGVNK
jgi:hypothetical protein